MSQRHDTEGPSRQRERACHCRALRIICGGSGYSVQLGENRSSRIRTRRIRVQESTQQFLARIRMTHSHRSSAPRLSRGRASNSTPRGASRSSARRVPSDPVTSSLSRPTPPGTPRDKIQDPAEDYAVGQSGSGSSPPNTRARTSTTGIQEATIPIKNTSNPSIRRSSQDFEFTSLPRVLLDCCYIPKVNGLLPSWVPAHRGFGLRVYTPKVRVG